MAYIPFRDWNPRPLTGNALNTTAKKNREFFCAHWDGGTTPKTSAESRRLLLAYDNHHRVGNRGGFPYGHAICPVTGDIYEGRGFDRIGAAVGGANTRVYSYIIIGGPGNLTEAAKRGVQELYQMATKHYGRALPARVHRDFNSTSCPGTDITLWVKSGGVTAGPAGGGGEPFPEPDPKPINPIESEEDEMKPKLIHRNTGTDEWMLVHPDYCGPTDPERGYLVTTDENRAIAWARVHGNGWATKLTGPGGRYTADVGRDGYIAIQEAARAEYDAKAR